MSCQRRASVLIFFMMFCVMLYMQCAFQVPDVKVVPPTKNVKVSIPGIATKGGTYNSHRWDGKLVLEVKGNDGVIYEFYIWAGADIVLIDQKKHKRIQMNSKQMCSWLDENKSADLCTMVGVYDGVANGLLVLIPGDPAPPEEVID